MSSRTKSVRTGPGAAPGALVEQIASEMWVQFAWGVFNVGRSLKIDPSVFAEGRKRYKPGVEKYARTEVEVNVALKRCMRETGRDAARLATDGDPGKHPRATVTVEDFREAARLAEERQQRRVAKGRGTMGPVCP